ncbi:MAG TPA: hypothetical protein VHS54_04760, partial [Jatrophihabitans sp.]|nr:hypothetical protein [Jatrophihabitans sp.]
MLPVALPAAVGVPVVLSGGQYVAQVLEQVDVDEVSEANMYRARPEPSVRNVPGAALRVATVTAAAPEVALPVPAPVAVPGFVELLQAASTSAAAAIGA